jgi:hypothetical protein
MKIETIPPFPRSQAAEVIVIDDSQSDAGPNIGGDDCMSID